MLYPSNTKSVDGGTLAEKYYIKVLSFKEKVSFNCYDIAYTSSRKNQYNHLIWNLNLKNKQIINKYKVQYNVFVGGKKREKMLINISFKLQNSIFIENDCSINFINIFRAFAVPVGWHF